MKLFLRKSRKTDTSGPESKEAFWRKKKQKLVTDRHRRDQAHLGSQLLSQEPRKSWCQVLRTGPSGGWAAVGVETQAFAAALGTGGESRLESEGQRG